jgi:hypothetical protein
MLQRDARPALCGGLDALLRVSSSPDGACKLQLLQHAGAVAYSMRRMIGWAGSKPADHLCSPLAEAGRDACVSLLQRSRALGSVSSRPFLPVLPTALDHHQRESDSDHDCGCDCHRNRVQTVLSRCNPFSLVWSTSARP